MNTKQICNNVQPWVEKSDGSKSTCIEVLTNLKILVWMSHVFYWKYLFASQGNYTNTNRLNGFSEGVIKVNKERNLTLVCFHCFNSSIFLSPFSFPECGWHRNPSKAFYQAFQSGSRLRDSKAHSDRYSTILQECNNMCAVFSSSKLCFFPRAWIEFENKAWQQAQDWPIDFSTTSLSLIFSQLLCLVFALTLSLSVTVYIVCHVIILVW